MEALPGARSFLRLRRFTGKANLAPQQPSEAGILIAVIFKNIFLIDF